MLDELRTCYEVDKARAGGKEQYWWKMLVLVNVLILAIIILWS